MESRARPPARWLQLAHLILNDQWAGSQSWLHPFKIGANRRTPNFLTKFPSFLSHPCLLSGLCSRPHCLPRGSLLAVGTRTVRSRSTHPCFPLAVPLPIST